VTTPDFTSTLNAAQLEAAAFDGGPLLIIAGAGTGKTHTLVSRVAWLISRGVAPEGILLLTFTRKAAGEMLQRCAGMAGARAGRVSGGTFHSLAYSLLRAEHRAAGYPPGFGILDQDDAEALVGRIRDSWPLREGKTGFPTKSKILQIISRSINRETSIKDTVKARFDYLSKHVRDIEGIAEEYASRKLRNAVMDFDDLLVKLAEVLAGDPEARERMASRYTHILVDEYQDTNPVQARIAWLLAREHREITAVGDDAQSIYGFRGADFRNIMEFPKIFSPAAIIKLEINYRSFGSILKVANRVASGAREKYEKALSAARGDGPPPVMVLTEDLRAEAAWVGGRIEDLLFSGEDPTGIAVLFRAGFHSIELELELIRRGIPYVKYGGRKFLESAHVRDYLAFFRLAHNPADEISLMRILQLFPGVGRKAASDAAAWVQERPARLLDFGEAPFRGRAAGAVAPLAGLFAEICRDGVFDGDPGEIPGLILDFYQPLMPRLYPDDFPDRQDDLEQLRILADSSASLSAFLAEVTLEPPNASHAGEAPAEGPRRDVVLSTIHSAKGLEWKTVFIVSAVNGRIPSSYALASEDEMEEERRLFYVAVTRAKDELYVMCPEEVGDSRNPYSASAAKPTRFLDGLPKGAMDVIIRSGGKVEYGDVYPGGSGTLDSQDGDFSDDDGWGPGFSDDSQLGAELPAKRRAAARKPAARPASDTEIVLEPAKGERVRHQTFGEGMVLSSENGKALIDFDSCGRKSVVCRYARLTRV
jgi:DNA helicase-2/ATP-dependent DNA helicase PcrA